MKDWIRKFRIRKFAVHIVSGSFTENDMYNAYNAGKNWMRGHIDANEANKYSGAKITNKEPFFNDWINTFDGRPVPFSNSTICAELYPIPSANCFLLRPRVSLTSRSRIPNLLTEDLEGLSLDMIY